MSYFTCLGGSGWCVSVHVAGDAGYGVFKVRNGSQRCCRGGLGHRWDCFPVAVPTLRLPLKCLLKFSLGASARGRSKVCRVFGRSFSLSPYFMPDYGLLSQCQSRERKDGDFPTVHHR